MNSTLNQAAAIFFVVLTCLSLASCVAAVPRAVQSPQPDPNASAQLAVGTVVALRPVTLSPEQPGEIASVNAVLTALNLGAVTPPIAGEEIVIQKDDGNTASIAEQNQSTSLSAGDQVMLVPGARQMIVRR